ncbi:MAG: hypothetical protein AB1656_14450 [Candidatus Omnitrophota bacterium]
MAKTIPTYEWLINHLRQNIDDARENTIDTIVNMILDMDESHQKIVLKRLLEEQSKANVSESTPDGSPMPKQKPATATDADAVWENNRAYFQNHEQEWKEKHPGLYVAVHNDMILYTGKELGSLAGRIYRQYGNIPFYASVPGEDRIEYIDFPIS